MPGRERPGPVGAARDVAVDGLAHAQVFVGDRVGEFQHICEFVRTLRIEEIEIVEPRLCRTHRRDPLHHHAMLVDIDAQPRPGPGPVAGIDIIRLARRRRVHGDLALHLHPVFRRIDFGIEARMDQRHMIAFEIILDIDFPVAAKGVRPAQRERVHGFIRPRRIDRAHHLADRRRLCRERDEQEAAPCLEPHRGEAMPPRVKPFGRTEIPRRLQPAFESEAPAMIAAGDRALAMALRLLCQRPGPVRADIVEGAHGAVLPRTARMDQPARSSVRKSPAFASMLSCPIRRQAFANTLARSSA